MLGLEVKSSPISVQSRAFTRKSLNDFGGSQQGDYVGAGLMENCHPPTARILFFRKHRNRVDAHILHEHAGHHAKVGYGVLGAPRDASR